MSNTTATLEYTVSIVPARRSVAYPNHRSAVAKACELAQQRGVDAWLTEDHTHFLKIATYRDRKTACV